jgi:hypothetical protein
MPSRDFAAAADAPWPELDRRFLHTGRSVPPPFPLDVIPEPWRPWIEGHAQGSTCVDYVAQALLAALVAVCGSRLMVDITPHWREPLLLWQALVGAPSTGKTPALVAGRRLLGRVTAPPDDAPQAEKLRADEQPLTAWLFHRGITWWYDDCDDWLLSKEPGDRAIMIEGWSGDPSRSNHALDLGRTGMRFPESIFSTLQADRLPETLSEADPGLLSRILYCWPVPRLDARLDRIAGDESKASALLQRLVDLPGTICEPGVLALEEAAAEHLQDLLPRLRAFMRDSDGIEAAWIGKAAGTIVRLAGLLSLMDWAATGGETPCTTVAEPHLERAHALWADYYWPHAQAVFGLVPSTLDERRVRRVGRWLQRMRPQTISREEVRCEALSRKVDADTAERLLERLEQYGAVRLPQPQVHRGAGRPRRRWEVNPELWAN